MAHIEIQAMDKSTVIGDVANRVNDSKLELQALSARTTKDHLLIITLHVEIHNIDELDRLLKKFKKQKYVYDAYRIGS